MSPGAQLPAFHNPKVGGGVTPPQETGHTALVYGRLGPAAQTPRRVMPAFRGDGRCEVYDRGTHPEDYSDEARCPEHAVETMFYLHGACELRVCANHLSLFPAHALDLGPKAPVAGSEAGGPRP